MANYPNPYTVSDIPSGWVVEFFGSTNAGFNQKVIITQDQHPMTTFSGQGEGVRMKDSNGKYIFDWTANGQPVSLNFEASNNGGRSYVPVRIARLTEGNSASILFYEFATEDFNDGDNNDTVFTILARNHG